MIPNNLRLISDLLVFVYILDIMLGTENEMILELLGTENEMILKLLI